MADSEMQSRSRRHAHWAGVVTGAGRGIGRETALRLAENGASVMVNDIDPEAVRLVVAEIEEAGGTAIGNTVDVGDRQAGEAIVDALSSEWGGVDWIVNNAGYYRRGPLRLTETTHIHRTIEVNLTGPLALLRAAWEPMRLRGGGRVLNLASGAMFGVAQGAAYAAAKAGLVGLTLSAAQDGRAHGILVNALLPTAATGMNTRGGPYVQDALKAAAVGTVAAALVQKEMAETGLVLHTQGGATARIGFTRGLPVLHVDDALPSILSDLPAVMSPARMDAVRDTRHHQELARLQHQRLMPMRSEH